MGEGGEILLYETISISAVVNPFRSTFIFGNNIAFFFIVTFQALHGQEVSDRMSNVWNEVSLRIGQHGGFFYSKRLYRCWK